MTVIPRPPSVNGLRDYLDEIVDRLGEIEPSTERSREQRDQHIRDLQAASAALEQVDLSGAVGLLVRNGGDRP